MADQTTTKELHDRSIGELLKQLADETSLLVRQEIELSKAELKQKIDAVRDEIEEKRGIASHELPALAGEARHELEKNGTRAASALALTAAAALAALFGVGGMTVFFVLALAEAMPDWAAALVVAAVYLAISGLLLVVGKARLRGALPLVPARLVGQLRTSARTLVTPSQVARAAVLPVPEQTIATLKEDVEWAKHPTKFAPRSKTRELR